MEATKPGQVLPSYGPVALRPGPTQGWTGSLVLVLRVRPGPTQGRTGPMVLALGHVDPRPGPVPGQDTISNEVQSGWSSPTRASRVLGLADYGNHTRQG